MRHRVKVNVPTWGVDLKHASLESAIKCLQDLLDFVPKEYRDTATFDFDVSERDGTEYHCYYTRPETSEEKQERTSRSEKYRKERIQQLEQELNRLKQ